MYTVKTIFKPSISELKSIIPFIIAETEKRKLNPKFNKENYSVESKVGMLSLINQGRFNSGGISILEDSTNLKAVSGFYIVNKILICGVRALVNSATSYGGMGLHAKYLISSQRDFANKCECDGVALTFNENNFRVIEWIEKNKAIHENLQVFKDFSVLNKVIIFNNTKQKIYWESFNKNISEAIIFNKLNNFTFC
jgi:hypothetical protein